MMFGETSKNCALCRRGSGFSLIEVLVALAIITLLAAITLPLIGISRRSSREQLCTAHCRDAGFAAALYAQDAKGCFPQTRIADSQAAAAPAGSAEWNRYTVQPWALAEGIGRAQDKPLDSPAWYCPLNQLRAADPATNWDYVASSTMYLAPDYLDPGLAPADWSTRLGARVQPLDRVAFPSAKVVVFELNVWHAFNEPFVPGRDVSRLEYQNSTGRASVFHADGHADRLAVRDAAPGVDRHPIWPGYAWDMTARGVLGRDR